MLNKRNTNLQNGCSTSREQISYGETAHYLAQRMVLEDDPRRTQHACDEDEYAQPTTGLYPNRALKATSPPIMRRLLPCVR